MITTHRTSLLAVAGKSTIRRNPILYCSPPERSPLWLEAVVYHSMFIFLIDVEKCYRNFLGKKAPPSTMTNPLIMEPSLVTKSTNGLSNEREAVMGAVDVPCTVVTTTVVAEYVSVCETTCVVVPNT